jgi:GntR family transcriptional regulator
MQRFVLRTNGTPAYRQMAHYLEQDMKRFCAVGERMALPSENELASEFKVSRVTARQALDELHRKGLIYREQGRGTYVRSQHVTGVSGFGSFTAEVSNAGARPGSRCVGFSRVPDLPEGFWRHLAHRPDPGPGYHRLTRVRSIDDRSVALEDSYLSAETYPDLKRADVEAGSLYEAMQQKWGHVPAWADAAIEPGIADAETAALLEIGAGTPVVVAWRVTSSEHDQVLEYVRSIYSGEGFALTVRRHKIG